LEDLFLLDPNFGMVSVSYAPMVSKIINRLGVTQLLDYGCGRARLFQHLQVEHPMKLQGYDPAIPGFSGDPIPMQMVTCIDVLEHVEPECLDAVLDDLVRVTEVIGFYTVCTEPAEKTLSDGSNAHKIIKPKEWWLEKIMSRFDLHTFQDFGNGFYVVVYAQKKPLVETLQ
jgi:hypothetical protein